MANESGSADDDFSATRLALQSSSTTERISHLRMLDDKISHTEANRDRTTDLLSLLFDTHSVYSDRESRRAVQSCLVTVLRSKPDASLLLPLVESLSREAASSGIAVSNAFVILEWCALLEEHLAGNAAWGRIGQQVITSHALCVEQCTRPESRRSLSHGAIVLSRRGLRNFLKACPEENLDKVINYFVKILTSADSKATARNAILLGILAGVCARIPTAKGHLQKLQPQYFQFYTKEVIGSRKAVPRHIAAGLGDFFLDFATVEDFSTGIVPPLEKGMLRSPEIVLKDVMGPLIASLPASFDLSKLLSGSLLKPILANVKSTNSEVRESTKVVAQAILSRCHDVGLMDKVATDILGPLKSGKLSSADQKILHAQMLGSVPLSTRIAQAACDDLVVVATKEGNESALSAETAALALCAALLLRENSELKAPVANAFVKGLGDKKAGPRRLWLLQAGEILYSAAATGPLNEATKKFAESVVPKLAETFKDVASNPATASQGGLVVGACIVCSLSASPHISKSSPALQSEFSKLSIPKNSLDIAQKSSFLLNSRIYSKFESRDDFQWFSRALFAVSQYLDESASPLALQAWSEAVIFMIADVRIPPEVRQDTSQALTESYQRRPFLISTCIINGLWDAVLSFYSQHDGLMRSTMSFNDYVAVLKAICPSSNDSADSKHPVDKVEIARQLCSLIVLVKPTLIPRANWIELCLRMGVDPGSLCLDNSDLLINEILQRTSPEQNVETVKLAAYEAAAELAFISPDVMIPKIVDLLVQDLSTEQLENIGPLEAAIFKTPEGTLVVDVLSKKSQQYVPNKNSKDYDILKWEEELRTKLQEKKGLPKKLTADETAKVEAQKKKESAVRREMGLLHSRLTRGFGIVKSLAHGPPTDPLLWISTAFSSLLGVLDAGASIVVGGAGSDALIACTEKITSRLGPSRSFIGVAMLRIREIVHLPAEYTQEPLDHLITRLLYRVRFVSEQRPLDAVSFICVLPLILDILRSGGFGSDEEEKNTQLVLATEVLSFHTDICAEEAVPRSGILSGLTSSMQRYTQHYKLIRDCFADMCRCVAPNMSVAEVSVLSRGAIVPEVSVRSTVLQSLSAEVDMSELGYSDEIWLACHDDEEENRELGKDIWEESGFRTSEDIASKMLPFLESKDAQLRRAAARSLAEVLGIHRSVMDGILDAIRSRYVELAKPKVQQLDQFGMPKKEDLSDPWEGRHGLGNALRELSPYLDRGQLDLVFRFLIDMGPLCDRNGDVRAEMLNAGIHVIECHGKGLVEALMQTFEQTLEESDKNSKTADLVNEAVIIMYGALAGHLKPGDSKIPVVIDRLLNTLSTPSETVQYAIAECLPPLVRSCTDKSSKYLDQVVETLLSSKDYATQRGAAYGLAGLVRGRGVGVLREYRIISTIKRAAENKKEAGQREAAFLALELLSTILGRLFEPYVIQIVPELLTGFGDGNANVRDACLAAAKACFARLSSYGVKQILPTLLDGLEDQQWRSKKGACDLLGAMAYLDPQQLAQSLPVIIPPLTGVLNDSHKEVRSAANKSLKRFGEVIKNPEIKGLVDILLKALSDPTKYTDDALDSLIKVQFVHYLDAPSLALVIRILQRGLDERSNTKRKASQVIGSLAHLTERKDLISHLPVLIAGLKIAAVDPVPKTRATASRALGSLVEKLGEDAMPDLIPGLMQTLKSESGAGDLLGSAQALSEVLAGLGTARLEETLPSILQNVESSRPTVREGFMSLFIFLPVCFGNSFANYLGRIIPPILAGLADDVESIRETALRAGRLLVKNFAVRAVDLLLPELERGLADDRHRIRLSSVELVGDLLFNLTGISGKTEPGEEDEEAAREASTSLREALGDEKRNKILSALYVCRCDTAGTVRAAAITVWKVLVHSPRTLKEITPTLTQLIIRRLGSANMEHKVIASNALGELIRKAGDGVLASLLPTLEEGLRDSTDSDAKQGICLALRELIASASVESLEEHEKTLISVVRAALTDADGEVREAAAEAFDSLQQILGKRAVDQVLPYLLNLLRLEGQADNALSALLTLLTETTRSNIILPNLIPTLTTPPISAFNARALASLSRVAGASMNRRLPNIINSLMDNIINCPQEELRAELQSSFDIVILSIDEYDGLNTVMNVLLLQLKHEDHRRRACTASSLARFFASAEVDYSRYNPDIVRSLLISFDDRDKDVVKSALAALTEFTKKLKKEEMEALAIPARQSLLQVGVAGSNLPGFELPKGVNAILPIFLQGLINGTPDQRVQAALAISDIIDRTSEASLKPFVTQMTGPLIRVVSERSTEVKSAVLLTLNNLLEKMPAALKPFLPQLQRTFAKSLADTSSDLLRTRAAKALGTLIKHTPRIDPLITELVAGSKTSDPGVKTAMLKALYEVISKAGANMGEPSRASVLALIDTDTDERDHAMTITNAKLLGALIKNVPEDAAHALLKNRVVTFNFSNSSSLALNAVLVESPEILAGSPLAGDLPEVIAQGMMNKSTFIADHHILACGKYLLSSMSSTFESQKRLFDVLAQVIQPGQPTDSRRLALVVVRTLSRANMDMVRPHLTLLALPTFASVRDPVIPVKLAAEAAFVSLFNIADEEGRIFDKFMAGAGSEVAPTTKRSMQDYFKRVGLRLGMQIRERREAEGGQGGLGLSNDEVEDEKEIWSVGRSDANDGGVFSST